ncbi:MAG TPA: hypothetical protein VK278_09305 [Gaiellaceae bacterium]|nr:hypothetical protein [Gaiellaceae bacterium]
MVGRAAALLALAAALGAYYATSTVLWHASLWWDVAWLALVLIPAVFALVLLALPLWDARGLLPVGIALVVLAVVCDLAGLDVIGDFSKLAAMTLLAWWFLTLFEDVSWAVIVALVIPWVDAYSVWRGPTRHIVEKRVEVFDALSFAFPTPGGGAALLGLPDLLFYALFLAAAVRWRLRVRLTWLCMTLSFGATMTLAIWGDVDGLPALPLLSVGFLAPNADLLWRQVRELRRGSREPEPEPATE